MGFKALIFVLQFTTRGLEATTCALDFMTSILSTFGSQLKIGQDTSSVSTNKHNKN